ncbi:MAG: STAS domain-containing protein [Phycisphaerales bacterium]|nr:STAS domain-containing protein [Phycisphaerales bacterium]
MSLTDWSENIIIAELAEEPAFSDDMTALLSRIEDLQDKDSKMPDVIVNLAEVEYLNSSNIAQLLRLRKRLAACGSRLRICSVGDQVWGVILVTGLDKLFEFHSDVATALASLHIEA